MDRTVQGTCWACGLGRLRLRVLDGVLALAERYRSWFGEDWGRNGRELGLPGIRLISENGGLYFLSARTNSQYPIEFRALVDSGFAEPRKRSGSEYRPQETAQRPVPKVWAASTTRDKAQDFRIEATPWALTLTPIDADSNNQLRPELG